MTSEIQRRLQALESKAGTGKDRIGVIIRRIVSPGPDGPVYMEPGAYISMPSGWRVDREPGEDADAFLERARNAVVRREGGIPRLVEA